MVKVDGHQAILQKNHESTESKILMIAMNEEVRRKIRAATGEYDELLALVKQRKLKWSGHVSRSSDLAKTIIQGTVKGN